MANRSFEMYEYRQVLQRMRQGDTDRAIGRSKLMGRKKARKVRAVAEVKGWLDRTIPLPEDRELAATLGSTTNWLALFRRASALWG